MERTRESLVRFDNEYTCRFVSFVLDLIKTFIHTSRDLDLQLTTLVIAYLNQRNSIHSIIDCT